MSRFRRNNFNSRLLKQNSPGRPNTIRDGFAKFLREIHSPRPILSKLGQRRGKVSQIGRFACETDLPCCRIAKVLSSFLDRREDTTRGRFLPLEMLNHCRVSRWEEISFAVQLYVLYKFNCLDSSLEMS